MELFFGHNVRSPVQLSRMIQGEKRPDSADSVISAPVTPALSSLTLSYVGDDFLDSFMKMSESVLDLEVEGGAADAAAADAAAAAAATAHTKEQARLEGLEKKAEARRRKRASMKRARDKKAKALGDKRKLEEETRLARAAQRLEQRAPKRGVQVDLRKNDIAEATHARLLELRRLTQDPRRKPLYMPPAQCKTQADSQASSSAASTPVAETHVLTNLALSSELSELMQTQRGWGASPGPEDNVHAQHCASMDERTKREGIQRLEELARRAEALTQERAAAVEAFSIEEDGAADLQAKIDGIHTHVVRRHMNKVRQRIQAELVDQQLAVQTHEYIVGRLTGLTAPNPAAARMHSTMQHHPSVLESAEAKAHRDPYKMIPQKPKSPPRHYSGTHTMCVCVCVCVCVCIMFCIFLFACIYTYVYRYRRRFPSQQ
jgi:hypothetical protein